MKYTTYIRPIISEHFPEKIRKLSSVSQSPTSGRGINIITLPCNSNALLERMDLLIESKKAGNTGVNFELEAIINKLLKDKVIEKQSYKKLISLL